tara:strand:+ start:2867 stop:3040 length:174 start_codon:yes stop_codon:yes gene_type:complete
MIKSKYGDDFFNVFKTIVFLEKEIKEQLEDKNHDVNKLISDKKLLKHFTSISLKRMQ